jgi:hypothetical protein
MAMYFLNVRCQVSFPIVHVINEDCSWGLMVVLVREGEENVVRTEKSISVLMLINIFEHRRVDLRMRVPSEHEKCKHLSVPPVIHHQRQECKDELVLVLSDTIVHLKQERLCKRIGSSFEGSDLVVHL